MCRGMPSCPWGSRGGGPGRGLVGFLWGTPEASAGSRSRPFRGFGSGLPGRFAARVTGSWQYLGCRTRLIPGA